jgi:hypothetical protein
MLKSSIHKKMKRIIVKIPCGDISGISKEFKLFIFSTIQAIFCLEVTKTGICMPFVKPEMRYPEYWTEMRNVLQKREH